jgi:heme exporter protein D
LRSLYDAFEFRWNLHVVNFNSGMQSQIVSGIAAAWVPRWDEMTAAVLAWMRQVNIVFDLGPAGYVWLGIVAFALVLAIIVAVKVTRRVLRLRAVLRLRNLHGARRARLLRQLGFYLDMLGVLERGGAGKPAWQPPAHFAAHLQPRDPALAGLVSELTDLFYLSRFGGRDLDRDQLGRAARLLRDLATRLRVTI